MCPAHTKGWYVGFESRGGPHTNGLSSNKMALITSDRGAMRLLAHQMALIASSWVPGGGAPGPGPLSRGGRRTPARSRRWRRSWRWPAAPHGRPGTAQPSWRESPTTAFRTTFRTIATFTTERNGTTFEEGEGPCYLAHNPRRLGPFDAQGATLHHDSR